MNLRDLEKRRKHLQESIDEVRSGLYTAGWDGFRQMEFLDKLIECFSTKKEGKPLSKTEARIVFDKVYGFQKQKEELTQYISAQNYLNSQAGSNVLFSKILCFVGPPGVGKTVFARIISEILGKEFYLIPLSGKSEAIVLTGDLPSFKMASCGQIVEAIIKTKSTNLVILLDEVDKAGEISKTAGGEIPGIRKALLEILDPLQNKEFKDQYIDAKIDLSQITFVLTANTVDDLDPALKSRIEIIELEGYSPQDKKHIAKLILEELFEKVNYLNYKYLEISDAAWEKLISLTHEEGVRQIKQGINKILIYCYDKWAEDHNNNRSPRKILIDPAKIEEIIPKEFVAIDKQEQKCLKEEKEREELINLDKQWRNNQRQFQNKLLIMLGIVVFLLAVMIVIKIFKKRSKKKFTQ